MREFDGFLNDPDVALSQLAGLPKLSRFTLLLNPATPDVVGSDFTAKLDDHFKTRVTALNHMPRSEKHDSAVWKRKAIGSSR